MKKNLNDSRTRINEGIIILFSRAMKRPGLVIPIVSRNLEDATYYYQAFCKYLVRGRLKSVNRLTRIIELTNGSRFTFPVEGNHE